MVEYADRLVGQLVDRLDALGLRERTLVFVATDNGAGGRLGGEKLASLLGGKGRVVLLRYVWRVGALADLPSAEVVRAVGPAVQRYLSEPLPEPPTAGA